LEIRIKKLIKKRLQQKIKKLWSTKNGAENAFHTTNRLVTGTIMKEETGLGFTKVASYIKSQKSGRLKAPLRSINGVKSIHQILIIACSSMQTCATGKNGQHFIKNVS